MSAHQHGQDGHDISLADMFTETFWDERYASSTRIWSGKPNVRLVEQVAPLTVPAGGTALDVGCGEGADVVWLAQQGWQVTGVDVSGVALERAEQHAVDAGVGERTSWVRADLYAGDPLPTGNQLVTSSFMHVPPESFERVYKAVADAVGPGGTLVVLAHHPADAHLGIRNPELNALLFAPDAVVDLLDPAEWDVHPSEPTREMEHDGRTLTLTETVVRAVRRG
ncbi:MAG: class I SAM-dependent methyltransferase [Nocardioides sp.]